MNLDAKIIKPKLGVLELSRQLGSVMQACKVFGYSRDSFYRFKKLYEERGELALRDIVRLNKPNTKNRVAPEIEAKVVQIALDNPALGQQRVSNELRKEGLFISPGGVRSVEMLQDDLDEWVREYNEKRPHSGKYCYGKTPIQTFLDSLPLAKEKMLQYSNNVSSQNGI